MTKIKFLIALLFVSLTFISCDSSDGSGSNQNDDAFAQNFGAEVSKDFIGQVVDTNNDPIQNATIKIGTATAQTDANGVFIINGATVHEKFAYITAFKAGYMEGSRTMVPTSGKNNVKIMLIPNAPLQTIQSGVDSEVALPSGTKVVFDGEFQDEDGNPYTGSISVAMFHLLPSDENISKLMPGMLYAQTSTNQQAALETYGMLNVELRGNAGQKLNIKNGHTAEITMKIDSGQISSAPNSIPLWHFDEEKGYWKEDGVATKIGDKYVGEVSHFSWWNCDAPFETVTLISTVVDSEGNPVANVEVYLAATDSVPRAGITDGNGQASGLIPANQLMTLNIYDVCGNVIYNSQVGPYTQETNLVQIELPGSSVHTTTVSGSLLKCDETIVTNGYVILKNGNKTLLSGLENGNYNFTTVTCSGSDDFTIKGFDFDTQQTTGELNYLFQFPQTHIDPLKACNSINEYITFSINGENTIISSNISSQIFLGIATYGNNLFANQMTIYANYGTGPGGGAIQTPGIAIECGSTAPGNYTLNNTSVRISTSSTPNQYFFIYGPPEISNYNFRINKFGALGDYIDVTFSGTIKILQISYIVTGTAHVLRDH